MSPAQLVAASEDLDKARIVDLSGGKWISLDQTEGGQVTEQHEHSTWPEQEAYDAVRVRARQRAKDEGIEYKVALSEEMNRAANSGEVKL